MPDLQDFDMDENLIHKVNSKYYDVIDFPKVKKNPHSFSLFHANLQSLSAHLEELQLLLKTLKVDFDIIGISETKEQSGGFLIHVNLDGYSIYSWHSSSVAGGVALYVKTNLDYIIHEDLSVLEDEFETLWVEIQTKRVKIYCAVVHTGIQIPK